MGQRAFSKMLAYAFPCFSTCLCFTSDVFLPCGCLLAEGSIVERLSPYPVPVGLSLPRQLPYDLYLDIKLRDCVISTSLFLTPVSLWHRITVFPPVLYAVLSQINPAHIIISNFFLGKDSPPPTPPDNPSVLFLPVFLIKIYQFIIQSMHAICLTNSPPVTLKNF